MSYIDSAILAIRLGAGFLMLSFGVTQFKNPMAWVEEYTPKWVRKMPFITLSMRGHAVINIGLGLLLLMDIGLSLISWVAFVWMLSILPFAFYRSWKTGARDLSTALALLALALLSVK